MWTPFLSRDQKKSVKRKKDQKKGKEKTNSVLPAQYDLEENTQPGFPQLVALPKAPHKHAIALSSSSASQLSILQTPTKPKSQGKVLHHQNPLKTNIFVQALFMHAYEEMEVKMKMKMKIIITTHKRGFPNLLGLLLFCCCCCSRFGFPSCCKTFSESSAEELVSRSYKPLIWPLCMLSLLTGWLAASPSS
jgi:hypothetical protein